MGSVERPWHRARRYLQVLAVTGWLPAVPRRPTPAAVAALHLQDVHGDYPDAVGVHGLVRTLVKPGGVFPEDRVRVREGPLRPAAGQSNVALEGRNIPDRPQGAARPLRPRHSVAILGFYSKGKVFNPPELNQWESKVPLVWLVWTVFRYSGKMNLLRLERVICLMGRLYRSDIQLLHYPP